MKKMAFLFLAVAAALFYFWPAQPDSGGQSITARIVGAFSALSLPGKDYGQELAVKREELKAYEDTLAKIENQIGKWQNEAESNICPQTGQKGTFEVTKDPRPDLHKKIELLRQEIAALELKVSK
ncbi:MAG: hypothetical protein OEW04_13205 [Nitrospirota bacterium]|nr:hypothetical protein [Nitrospirota bacterium]